MRILLLLWLTALFRPEDLKRQIEAQQAAIGDLEKLDERRILRTIDAAPGERTPRFEIRHDVLAGAVVEWNRQYEEARRREEDEIRQRAELEEERRRQRARIFLGSVAEVDVENSPPRKTR